MSDGPAAQSPWQTVTIARIEKRTPRVTSFFLQPLRPFAYRAGQHVDVRLTAPDGYQARRSYSIASAPEAG
ncbi:MAG: oxidoreductase, partial [Mesorhizobium sp.]